VKRRELVCYLTATVRERVGTELGRPVAALRSNQTHTNQRGHLQEFKGALKPLATGCSEPRVRNLRDGEVARSLSQLQKYYDFVTRQLFCVRLSHGRHGATPRDITIALYARGGAVGKENLPKRANSPSRNYPTSGPTAIAIRRVNARSTR
jgi:hypothetical protein